MNRLKKRIQILETHLCPPESDPLIIATTDPDGTVHVAEILFCGRQWPVRHWTRGDPVTPELEKCMARLGYRWGERSAKPQKEPVGAEQG